MKPALFFLLIISIAFSSCSRKDKKEKLMVELSIASLSRSNMAISQLSEAHYQSLSDKLGNTIYGERPVVWNNSAKKLKAMTDSTIKQIDLLESESLDEKLAFTKK